MREEKEGRGAASDASQAERLLLGGNLVVEEDAVEASVVRVSTGWRGKRAKRSMGGKTHSSCSHGSAAVQGFASTM